ncbi:MAG TPA: arsenate reductase ArsC [Candidatus Polarisedimenticolia bacterium]|jgi:arsenate reductase|nr:arsenate reductase ArsC [Candidatus Polarisedimenticolia bacterium]
MITVLFACVENAGRSQMAAALFNRLADPALAHAISAGTQPGDTVHPVVIEVMREAGIDLSSSRPRALAPDLVSSAGLLVTMGCGEACPVAPGADHEDWFLEDPRGQSLPAVRRIRDEISERVRGLILAKGWGRRV